MHNSHPFIEESLKQRKFDLLELKKRSEKQFQRGGKVRLIVQQGEGSTEHLGDLSVGEPIFPIARYSVFD